MNELESYFRMAAEMAVSEALDTLVFDHRRGLVRLRNRYRPSEMLEFLDLTAAKDRLIFWANEELATDGVASDLWTQAAEAIVDRLVRPVGLIEFFDAARSSSPQTLLIQGLLVPGAEGTVSLDMARVSDEMVRYLAEHPDKMQFLDPRVFEKLVAKLLNELGYETVLTPRSNDGGFDIRAYQKTQIGTVLTLVECKRYSPERPVGVGIVRALRGASDLVRPSMAMIATTSRFTAGAREYVAQIPFQMTLKDNADLTAWLREYSAARGTSHTTAGDELRRPAL
jgi:Restriction endonuclease